MSDVPTTSRRSVSSWIAGASAVMTTLVAVALVGPTVEELREEANRSRRGNALSQVALAVVPDQDTNWSPIWDGPGGAVPDYLVDIPNSRVYLTPRDGWAVTRTVESSFANTSEVESIAPPKSGALDGPVYFPNWDLFEPIGVRSVPTVRRARVVPEQIAVNPAAQTLATPSPDFRPLPIVITAAVAVE